MKINMKINMTYLINLRDQRGYSQSDMGKSLGMTRQSYYKIETGKVRLTMETFLRICEVLRVTPARALKEITE